MSKNVLILSASPRKGGNSERLCDQFMLGAKESGNEVEKIFFRDKKINYCVGCDFCVNNDGHCVQKDDVAEILEKMIKADVIIMATPVYYYTMNGQMKTFIDRTCARHEELNNKEFYFILAAADPNKEAMKATVDGFRGFMKCLKEPKEKGIIYGTGAWEKGEIEGKEAMKEAYEMGKNA